LEEAIGFSKMLLWSWHCDELSDSDKGSITKAYHLRAGSPGEPIGSLKDSKSAWLALGESQSTQWKPSNSPEWLSGRAGRRLGGSQISRIGSSAEPHWAKRPYNGGKQKAWCYLTWGDPKRRRRERGPDMLFHR